MIPVIIRYNSGQRFISSSFYSFVFGWNKYGFIICFCYFLIIIIIIIFRVFDFILIRIIGIDLKVRNGVGS